MNLFDHQKQGVEFLRKCSGKGALFWDMGTGKTVTALKTFELAKKRYPKLKLLVFCPLNLIEDTWREDTKTFTNFTFGNMRIKKQAKQYRKYDILCFNYESLPSKNKYTFIKEIIKEWECFCVLDESSKIKSHQAITYKNLNKLSENLKFKVIMSGTPCPNDYTELWTQMNFMRPGLLPLSFYKFRNVYFHLARGEQRMEASSVQSSRVAMQKMFSTGWSYKMSEEKKEELFRTIKPYTFWLKKEDCITLPSIINETRTIEMNKEQKQAYKEMKTDLITYIQDEAVTAQVALTKMMKLRQITGNFALTEKREAINISTNNPKMKELESNLEDIGKKQVIIWAVFRHDIGSIYNMLLKKGKKVGTLYGGTPNKSEIIKAFKDKKLQYVVCNPQSVAHGLTFANCSYSIYYSLDYSWENYIQSKNRIHRIGQTKKCTYIHLLMNDSIDQTVYQILQNKGDKTKVIEDFMRS